MIDNAASQLTDPARSELAEIIATYTQVTDKLKLSHDRLSSEVARLREELAGKDRLLQRRSRLAALGEMAAGIAHEIRNPLGGIALYADLMGAKVTDNSGALDIARKISSAVKGLDAIVCDVLSFAGEIEPRRDNILVGQLLGGIEDVIRAHLSKRGSQLSIDADSEMMVNVDKTQMIRVLSNLLSNAADAAGEGFIHLRIAADGSDLVIEVSDSGPGITPEAQERIFNPFYTTRHDGTGLGLAIVHRIVDSHDGSVTVDNVASPEGLGGARFKIVLSAAVVSAASDSKIAGE